MEGHTATAEELQKHQPHLRRLERTGHASPAESLFLPDTLHLTIRIMGRYHRRLFFGGQVTRSLGCTREDEEGNDAKDNRQKALTVLVSSAAWQGLFHTVNATYMIKIHAQPRFPPRPSIWTRAAASKPENAPASEVAEKKMATRLPRSARQ